MHTRLDLITNVIPSPALWTCTVALIGTAGVLVVSNALTKARSCVKCIILYIGKNTFAIVCLHEILIKLSYQYIEPYVSSHIVKKMFDQLFVWLMLVVCIQIINAYFPWLVGKQKAKV